MMELRAAVQAEEARRELARRSLRHFTAYTFPTFVFDPFHIDVLARLERFVLQIEAGEAEPRLLLNTPPRAGKSEMADIRCMAWFLGRNPAKRGILSSYAVDLCVKWSRAVRDLVASTEFGNIFPNCRLNPNTRAAEDWETICQKTNRRGGLRAAGVDGGLTGMGGDLIIIDDPFKNLEEADNAKQREKVWDWYQAVPYTRTEPGGGILCIQTRWNFDDLAGRLIAKSQNADPNDTEIEHYDVVEYPALAHSYEYIEPDHGPIHFRDEPMGELPEGWKLNRRPDEVLSPGRYSAANMRKRRANLDPRIWESLYQQRPAPESGLFFNENQLQTVASLPADIESVVTSWDFAISEKTRGDWTVGTTLVRGFNDHKVLANVQRGRYRADEIIELMLDDHEYWRRAGVTSHSIAVEYGQIWQTLAPTFMKRARERGLSPDIVEMKASTDKQTRAGPLRGGFHHKKISILDEQPWFRDLKLELLQFPAGKHDDIVDALSWGYLLYQERPLPEVYDRNDDMPEWQKRMNRFQRRRRSHMAA